MTDEEINTLVHKVANIIVDSCEEPEEAYMAACGLLLHVSRSLDISDLELVSSLSSFAMENGDEEMVMQ